MKKYYLPFSVSYFRFFLNAYSISKNAVSFQNKYLEKGNDYFSLKAGNQLYIITRSAEAIRHILQKNQRNYEKSENQTGSLALFIGNGLLTAKGNHWRRQRRLIQPGFHKKKIELLTEQIHQCVRQKIETLRGKNNMDVYLFMNLLAFDVVAESLFHTSISPQVKTEMRKKLEIIQRFAVLYIRNLHLAFWFRWNGSLKRHLIISQSLRNIISQIIRERENQKENHNDLLNMLFEAKYEDGKCMTHEQLIDEVIILFFAGHETTANALTFTIALLLENKTYLRKIEKEIFENQGKSSSAIYSNLKWTKAVISESMRLYPPAWFTDRVSLSDDQIEQYHIPKNTIIGLSFFELHRNSKYWENPLQFLPERFLENGKKEAYFPFGAGPRMCIGNNFAFIEMTLALFELFSKFRLEKDFNTIKFLPLVTLKPIGIQAKIQTRK